MAFPPTSPPLARALAGRNYSEPTPVQTAVLAPEAAGRDLLVSAQTGSGKTVAFGLAIADALLDGAESLDRAGNPLALVVAPTRELALQVQSELVWLYQHIGARIVASVGGMDPRAEKRELNAGCHVVVGTPGRLRDHLERGSLRVADLKAVVLDEADEMLDLGFREDLEFILEATPKERRTLLFSATLPREIAQLAKNYQTNALRIEASGRGQAHADIEYRAMRIAAQDGVHAVVNIVRFIDSPASLVFCNTRDAVRHLHAALVERGFSAVSLSGEFSQIERNHALQALRDGRARICVATDVAARGIDLPNLGLVIHADLPNDPETLQHRSGRTGRAGRKGISVLLVTPPHHRRAERLLAYANIKAAWVNPPTPDAIRKVDNERLLQSLLDADTGEAEDRALAAELLAQRSPQDIAAALVRIYRSRLPAPEDLMETGMPPARGAGTGLSDAVWFRLNVGRRRKADPKWLIPEICRQGGVTKREIGAIRIFDEETKFEIDAGAADKFAARVAKVAKGDIAITPADAPAGGGHVRRAPKHGGGKHEGARHEAGTQDRGKKAWKAKHKPTHGDTTAPRKDKGKPLWAGKAKHHGGKDHAGKPHGGKPDARPTFGRKKDGKHGGKPHGAKKH
ncbi:MAG: DEAD/DEAH box helicase [Rhodospirillaceae bacterium]